MKEKCFYAIVPKWGDEKTMKVLLLGDTKKMANQLYSNWNDGIEVTPYKMKNEDLVYKRFRAENL
jgi:hypothetical protein